MNAVKLKAGTKLKDRFFDHVHKASKDNCWRWNGSKTIQGYGRIKHNGKHYAAHRLSYMIHKGKIPKGMLVCHTCDNPPCVNPNHLWLGTQADNQKDCFQKGRRATGKGHWRYLYPEKIARGEKSSRSSLTNKDVREIRRLAGTMSQEKIGAMFNTPQTNVSKIIRRKAWKHID